MLLPRRIPNMEATAYSKLNEISQGIILLTEISYTNS